MCVEGQKVQNQSIEYQLEVWEFTATCHEAKYRLMILDTAGQRGRHPKGAPAMSSIGATRRDIAEKREKLVRNLDQKIEIPHWGVQLRKQKDPHQELSL